MKITKKGKFRLELATILIFLMFHNRTVFSVMEVQHCKTENNNACVVVCRDWDLGLRNGFARLKRILQAKEKEHQTCGLILERCTLKTETTSRWESLNTSYEPKINDLKIFHGSLDINRLNLRIFQNVQNLTLKNTTTAILQPKVFLELPKLRRLHLQQNAYLKRAVNGFLQNLTLEYLQIQGMDLNQTKTVEFFQNLTGEREIPSVRELDWSHNNFGNFPKNLLTPFPNLKVLILTNASIYGFQDEIFNGGNLTRVIFDENKIENLPEKIFRPLLEKGAFVSLQGNPVKCDCEMDWMADWIVDKNIRIDCAVPEKRFPDVGMCSNIENPLLCTFSPKKYFNKISSRFKITNKEPDTLEIIISGTNDLEKMFLWYGNYENMTFPDFKCLKIVNQNLKINVKPDINYLICLTTVAEYSQVDISDCLPLKTRPHHEDQPWLTKKSIPISIISIFIVLLFALAAGALILYLSVRKNPSLIRGSKRVIEVKKHDKAQILIMPRGYEPLNPAEGSPLALTNAGAPLEPSRSCDDISTVSYVSANQPTQLEILTYRFNRLRELFQRNTVPSFLLPTRMPSQIITPVNQRLPPNVDLLLEYEWYTITTTTTIQE